jgi:hypothetical protein
LKRVRGAAGVKPRLPISIHCLTALRETFPASDPIAICIDRPLEAPSLGNLQDPDSVAMPPPAILKVTEPKSTLVSLYDANLWGINQIFDRWLLLVGGRTGK